MGSEASSSPLMFRYLYFLSFTQILSIPLFSFSFLAPPHRCHFCSLPSAVSRPLIGCFRLFFFFCDANSKRLFEVVGMFCGTSWQLQVLFSLLIIVGNKNRMGSMCVCMCAMIPAQRVCARVCVRACVCVCPLGSICLPHTFDCLVINVWIDLYPESLQADSTHAHAHTHTHTHGTRSKS